MREIDLIFFFFFQCEAPARVRTGSIEIKGLHSWKLKEWLTSLGF